MPGSKNDNEYDVSITTSDDEADGGSEYRLLITPEGELRFIHDDALIPLRDALTSDDSLSTRRASHVEPTPDGRSWTADMGPSGGPVLGPFSSRQEALDAEKAWLLEHRLPAPS